MKSSVPSSLLIIGSSLIGLIYGCCDTHLSAATCAAEVGMPKPCVWLTDPAAINLAGGQQCVATDNADCISTMLQQGVTTRKVCPPGPAAPAPPTDPTAPAPAPPPGPTCKFAPCDNDNVEYNIQFILDESGSVGASNYDNSVDFVKELIRKDVNSVSPVSVFSFSNVVDTLYTFNQGQAGRAAVLSALDAAKSTAGAYQGRCTDTLSALEDSVAEYERAANAGDLNTGDRFLFLITDGVPYCGCGLDTSVCKTDVCGASGAAVRQKLGDLGIRVFTMGIGNFDITTIQCLSDADDVFQVSGFTSDHFKALEEQVRPTLCPAVTSWWERVFAKMVGFVQHGSLLEKALLIVMSLCIMGIICYGGCRLYHGNRKSTFGYLNSAVDEYEPLIV